MGLKPEILAAIDELVKEHNIPKTKLVFFPFDAASSKATIPNVNPLFPILSLSGDDVEPGLRVCVDSAGCPAHGHRSRTGKPINTFRKISLISTKYNIRDLNRLLLIFLVDCNASIVKP